METFYIIKILIYIGVILFTINWLFNLVRFRKSLNNLRIELDSLINTDMSYTVNCSVNGGKSLHAVLKSIDNKIRINYNTKHDTVVLNCNGDRVLIRMYGYNKNTTNKILDELINVIEKLN